MLRAGRWMVLPALGIAGLLGACGSDSQDGEVQPQSGKSCGPAVGEVGFASGTEGSGIEIADAVEVTAETAPVRNSGDAADDPAIWVHPEQPSLSLVIGTDKRGGISVYELSGIELEHRPDGEINNVDLRCDYRVGGEPWTVVTAGNRTSNTIAVYRLDPDHRRLVDVAARPIETGVTIYGSCMYMDEESARLFHFATSHAGRVEQWELFGTPDREIDAKLVRSFALDSTAEACVVDDETDQLYVAEEARGIWKLSARPGRAPRPRLIATTQDEGGELVPDVEGVAIARGADGSGILIASSQGDNSYVIYDLAGRHRPHGRFRIVGAGGIDGTEATDGIAATSAGLAPQFPRGLLVAQDGDNGSENQNYKLVRLDAISAE